MRKIVYRYLLLIIFCFTHQFLLAQQNKGVTPDDNTIEKLSGKTRALIVGISKYQFIESLQYADKDAQEFSSFLSSSPFWNVPSEDIKLLTNDNAKCGEIISELSRIIQVSKPGDRVIFYFSGHGDVETITQFNNGYLLTNDTYKNNYITGAIPVNFIKEVFLTLLNKDVKVFMFTDACRSGTLAGGLKGAEFATAAISAMWKNEIKILSSQPGKLSYEDKKWGNGRGVFSYYLTQGLSGAADSDKDSLITLSELEMYVGKNVAEATGYKQQPIFEGPDKFSTIISRIYKNNIPSSGKPGGNAVGMKTLKNYTAVDSCLTLYKQFSEAINSKRFVNDPSSATFYYQKLKLCSNDVDLILRADSKLIAAVMDSVQQIINNSLVGKKLVSQEMYESGIELLDEVLRNNDIKIPEAHLKNLRRYMFVTSQVLWNPIVSAQTQQTFLTIIDSALMDEPDAAYLLNTKGIVFMALDKFPEAITVFQKALQSSPSWLMPKYYLGIAFSKQNKYQKALNYYEEIFAKDPELKSFECTKCIIEEMAGLAAKLNDHEKAIRYYHKNLDLFPEYTNSYSGLSELIKKTKNKKAADELIVRLYKFNDSMYARVLRIRMVMEFYKKDKKMIPELIDSVELIVKDRFDSAELELLRGAYSIDFDRAYDEAYDHFSNAMNLVPDELYYMEDLLNLLTDYGKYKEMEIIIKEKRDNYSKEEQYKLTAVLGISYIGQNKLREAFNEFKKIYDIGLYTCDDIKSFNKHFKKLPEYNEFIKKCSN